MKNLVIVLSLLLVSCGGGEEGIGKAEDLTEIPVILGSIYGTISDPSTRKAISGVTVSIHETEHKTPLSGIYFVSGIPVGEHKLTFTKTGYVDYVHPNIEIIAGKNINFNVSLHKNIKINVPPVAKAGQDESVKTSTYVTLDGSNSYDDDDDILSYEWVINAKPEDSTVLILDADNVIASVVPDMPGEYKIDLAVSDGSETVTDTMILTVTGLPDESPPNAIIKIDNKRIMYFLGEEVAVKGNDSYDPDDINASLTYNWNIFLKPENSKYDIADITADTITFKPDAIGIYVIELTIYDEVRKTDIDYIAIAVYEYANPTVQISCADNYPLFYDEVLDWEYWWLDTDWIEWTVTEKCWFKINFYLPNLLFPSGAEIYLVGGFQNETNSDDIYIDDNINIYKEGDVTHFFRGGTGYEHTQSNYNKNPTNGWTISPVKLQNINFGTINTYYLFTDDTGGGGGMGKIRIKITPTLPD